MVATGVGKKLHQTRLIGLDLTDSFVLVGLPQRRLAVRPAVPLRGSFFVDERHGLTGSEDSGILLYHRIRVRRGGLLAYGEENRHDRAADGPSTILHSTPCPGNRAKRPSHR